MIRVCVMTMLLDRCSARRRSTTIFLNDEEIETEKKNEEREEKEKNVGESRTGYNNDG